MQNVTLSDKFRAALDALPAKYADNATAYDAFVTRFGTHYFEMAKFGGFMYQQTTIDNEFVKSSDEREITLNMKASFEVTNIQSFNI